MPGCSPWFSQPQTRRLPGCWRKLWVITNGRSSTVGTQWVEANVTAKPSISYGLGQKWPHAEVKRPAFGSAPEGLSRLSAQAACLPACKDCIKQARRWALLPARQPACRMVCISSAPLGNVPSGSLPSLPAPPLSAPAQKKIPGSTYKTSALPSCLLPQS